MRDWDAPRPKVAVRPRPQRRLALAILMLALRGAPAAAESLDEHLWGTNGTVTSILRSGNTLYVAGTFEAVGPCTGGGVVVSSSDGAPRPGYPRVAGRVGAVVPDGLGGWYIGGEFVAVGGEPRRNLAHILADGRVAEWRADADTGEVRCLALAGHTLYVGGDFTRIGGRERRCIAAVDTRTGQATDWNPSASRGVSALVVRGDVVYAGGDFGTIGGEQRLYAAAIDRATGRARRWQPDPDGPVYALAHHQHRVYVGGGFMRIGGADRLHLAAVDDTAGLATNWDPSVTAPPLELPWDQPSVRTILIDGTTAYIAGRFTTVGANERAGLAQVDLETGRVMPWDPKPGPPNPWAWPFIWAVAKQHDRIYVSGAFWTIGGQPRVMLAAVDAVSGLATDWRPDVTRAPEAIAVGEHSIYLGGRFESVGAWQRRNNLAAIDLVSGAVKDWNPNPDGYFIRALALDAGVLYVGGDFSQIGGQLRSCIAAVDTLTGAATSWDPEADYYVNVLAVQADRVYAGGWFWEIGGEPRKGMAALDRSTGHALDWNPRANDAVFSIVPRGGTIYVGGFFEGIGGAQRGGIAALDSATAQATAWDPSVSYYGWVNTLVVQGSTVYAGGVFSSMGGQPRTSVAAIELASGAVRDWNPSLSPPPPYGGTIVVEALAALEGTIYIGGQFGAVSGQWRPWFAAVDSVSGAATEWVPDADGVVWALHAAEHTVYAGGAFRRMGLTPHASLVAIDVSGLAISGGEDTTARPVRVTLLQNAPNPSRGHTSIRFVLPTADRVTLAVYDLQGRRVTAPLTRELRPTGPNVVPINTDGWRPGCYLYRLEVGSTVQTRRMVVLR